MFLLECADPAGLIFARQEFQFVLARRENDAALVDQRMLLDVLEMFRVDFHRDGVAQRAHHAVGFRVAHFGREIECGFAAAAFLRPLQRAGREFRVDRHEHLIRVQPELRGFHGHGQLDFRSFRLERFLELPLAVFRREDAEILRRVVAFARANVHAGGKRIDFHVHAPPGAVIRRVRAVISHQIVSGRVVLHALKNLAEVSDVEKGAPAGVSRKRRQGIARILARLALGNDGCAGEHCVAAGRARAGVASRRRRQQPARIDAVDGNVGAVRGVGRGDELRAIFLAGLRDAAGELNDRFLAGNSFEDFAQRFDGGEFPVRIENVEFRVVGGERRAGVFA